MDRKVTLVLSRGWYLVHVLVDRRDVLLTLAREAP